MLAHLGSSDLHGCGRLSATTATGMSGMRRVRRRDTHDGRPFVLAHQQREAEEQQQEDGAATLCLTHQCAAHSNTRTAAMFQEKISTRLEVSPNDHVGVFFISFFPSKILQSVTKVGPICRLLRLRYDSETPHEIKNEALYRACRAYGLQVGEQFLAAAQDEGTFGEWLDELPFEVAGCGDRPAAQAPHALWRVGPLGGGGAPRRHRAPRSSAETQTGPRHY